MVHTKRTGGNYSVINKAACARVLSEGGKELEKDDDTDQDLVNKVVDVVVEAAKTNIKNIIQERE